MKFCNVAGFPFAVAAATSELMAFQFPQWRDEAGVFRVKLPVHRDDSFWYVQWIWNQFLNERGCDCGVCVWGR